VRRCSRREQAWRSRRCCDACQDRLHRARAKDVSSDLEMTPDALGAAFAQDLQASRQASAQSVTAQSATQIHPLGEGLISGDGPCGGRLVDGPIYVLASGGQAVDCALAEYDTTGFTSYECAQYSAASSISWTCLTGGTPACVAKSFFQTAPSSTPCANGCLSIGGGHDRCNEGP
jgi:hypothetical protein